VYRSISSLSSPRKRRIVCRAHSVQPRWARYASASQVRQPPNLTIIKTKVNFSGLAGPCSSTCSTRVCQVSSRRSCKTGITLEGKRTSVSELLIKEYFCGGQSGIPMYLNSMRPFAQLSSLLSRDESLLPPRSCAGGCLHNRKPACPGGLCCKCSYRDGCKRTTRSHDPS
jgi:hypothetical protein